MAGSLSKSTSRYQQLAQTEDHETERNKTATRTRVTKFLNRPFTLRDLLLFHIVVFGTYVVSILIIQSRPASDRSCISKFSTASPALPIVKYQPPHHFDAEIVQKNKFRGYPTPEIDEAWQSISINTPAIRIFDEDLRHLNKSDTSERPLHRIPDELGGGYLAMLEVFHLLHCLDSLRKAMDKEYYIKEWEEVGEKAMRAHNEHCIDILRESIMCNSDVTPITFYDNVLMPERKLPMPDFNTLHTCRDFEQILEWNANNEGTLQWDEIGLELGGKESIDG